MLNSEQNPEECDPSSQSFGGQAQPDAMKTERTSVPIAIGRHNRRRHEK